MLAAVIIDHRLLADLDESSTWSVEVQDHEYDGGDQEPVMSTGKPVGPRSEPARIAGEGVSNGGDAEKSEENDVWHSIAKYRQTFPWLSRPSHSTSE